MPQRENNNIRLQGDETGAVLDIIHRYAKSWSLLLQYDEDRLEIPKDRHPSKKSLGYDAAVAAIASLKSDLMERGEASDLFGQERGHGLKAILGNIDQTFGGQDLYPSVEEKAAHLLYFVIKDHPIRPYYSRFKLGEDAKIQTFRYTWVCGKRGSAADSRRSTRLTGDSFRKKHQEKLGLGRC
jgi:hypothetical protein